MMYDSLVNKPIHTFNIDIIERQENIIEELREQLKGDDYNNHPIEDIEINIEKNIYKDKRIFDGDTVYIRTGSNPDVVIDDYEFLEESGLYKKVSSEDILGEPIVDEPIVDDTILSTTPTPDMIIFEEIDSYMTEVHNKVSPWHIFFILFIAFLITRLINIDLKLNVDI